MAVYDLEEQDQIDELKAWWTQWGNLVTGIVIAVCVAIVAVQGWRYWQASRQDQASALYTAVSDAARAGDAAKAKDAVAQLTDKFAGTAYAPRAALLYARLLWDAGDKDGARAQYQWVLDQAGDDELKQVTRYRLAEALLDAGKTDDALRLLDAKHDDGFAGLYADLRGDALAASGKRDDARAAYQAALAKLDTKTPYRNYVQVKLDSLGGPTAAAGAGINTAPTPGVPASTPAPVVAPAPAAPPSPAAPAPAAPKKP